MTHVPSPIDGEVILDCSPRTAAPITGEVVLCGGDFTFGAVLAPLPLVIPRALGASGAGVIIEPQPDWVILSCPHTPAPLTGTVELTCPPDAPGTVVAPLPSAVRALGASGAGIAPLHVAGLAGLPSATLPLGCAGAGRQVQTCEASAGLLSAIPDLGCIASGITLLGASAVAPLPSAVLPLGAVVRERPYQVAAVAALPSAAVPLGCASTAWQVQSASGACDLPRVTPGPLGAVGEVSIDLALRYLQGIGVRARAVGGAMVASRVASGDTVGAVVARAWAVPDRAGSRVASGLAARAGHGEDVGVGLTERHTRGGGVGIGLGVIDRHGRRLMRGLSMRDRHGGDVALGLEASDRHGRRLQTTVTQSAMHGRPVIIGVSAPVMTAIHIALPLLARWAKAWPLRNGYWWPQYRATPISVPVRLDCYPAHTPRPLTCPIVLGAAVQPYCPGMPDPGGSIIIPLLEGYYMRHDITVSRDGVSLPWSSISATLDAEAHTWSYSITLLGRAALDAVADIDSADVILDIDANGWQAKAIIDDWRETVAFNRRGITLSCSGLTSELGASRQLPISGTLSQSLTIQQVLAELLPIGAAYTLSWDPDTPTWPVPAGAWSWSRTTPIEAIYQAAQAVGMRLDPDPVTRAITIVPRYPLMPWEYGDVPPDLEIPRQSLLTWQRQQTVGTSPNGVYVHGGDIGGILGHVVRRYSAGDRLANTVSHPLITDADAARVLGRRILAAGHPACKWASVTMPFGGDFPAASVGQVVRINAGGDTDTGTVSNWSMTASCDPRTGAVTASQTLSMRDQSANLYARLLRLMPGQPTLWGTVVGVQAATVDVETIGGGEVRVRGTATVGDSVWIRGRELVGAAPGMAAVSIEV